MLGEKIMNKKKIADGLYTLAIPLIMFVLMELICLLLKDRHVIGSLLDVKALIRRTGISAITAFALSFNLSCGRFDLSLGAQRLAGTIVGGTIALSLGLSGIWLLLFALLFGLLFGFLTGVVFVLTRIPPMILGIGIGLIWECIPYLVSDGKGLNLFGVPGNEILTDTTFIIVFVVLIAVFVYFLMNTTRFGYQMRAIQGSQSIAQNSGIKIFSHAVLCYTLAGGFVCIGGALDAAYSNGLASTLGLASNSPIVSNIFAMMLGEYIGRRSNQAIGILVAALTITIFGYGLTMLEFSEANTSIANMALFIVFLVFYSNQGFLANKKSDRARIAQALEKKAQGIS